ncbi:UNVERIFIED_CONTAM: hypothetical protein FKN15_012860 [Acipenser sinensis]
MMRERQRDAVDNAGTGAQSVPQDLTQQEFGSRGIHNGPDSSDFPSPREVPLPSQNPFMCFQVLKASAFDQARFYVKAAHRSGISSSPNFKSGPLQARL